MITVTTQFGPLSDALYAAGTACAAHYSCAHSTLSHLDSASLSLRLSDRSARTG